VKLTYQLTLGEFREGIRAYGAKYPSFRRRYRVLTVLLVIAACAWSLQQALQPDTQTRESVTLLLMVWAIIGWMLLLPCLSARSTFRYYALGAGPTTLEIDESGLRVQTRGWQASAPWRTFNTWAELGGVFILIASPCLVVVPKRSLGSEEDAFRELLQHGLRLAEAPA
jgi:hypothetical protein